MLKTKAEYKHERHYFNHEEFGKINDHVFNRPLGELYQVNYLRLINGKFIPEFVC